MKRFVSIILFSLPLCLWAKEDGMTENAMPLVEQPMESGAESLSEVPAENPAGTMELTETVENPAGTTELTEAEKLIQQESRDQLGKRGEHYPHSEKDQRITRLDILSGQPLHNDQYQRHSHSIDRTNRAVKESPVNDFSHCDSMISNLYHPACK